MKLQTRLRLGPHLSSPSVVVGLWWCWGLLNVVDTFGAVSSGGGSVMVQVCGVVDAEVSTCHVIKLLRVGSNDFVHLFYFTNYFSTARQLTRVGIFFLSSCVLYTN
jgi:hypothetical protein